jgi:putative peptide zinc metalloprotease protein
VPDVPPPRPSAPAAPPARFRLRGDLITGTQEYGGKLCYVLKDPVTLSYFRFAPKEYRVLQQITGRTVAEICAAVEQLGDERPSESVVQEFLAQLLASGLVVREGGGDGRLLHARKQALQKLRRRSWTGSLVYLKFPGFDPSRVLDRLYPLTAWLFTPLGVAAAIGLMLFAGGYTLVHLDEFVARIKQESLESFFSWWTLLWFWIALGVSKVLHEFGHGLTCRHFGGECHEMGFLLLVMSPALYCDTTDAWTMPNKWHRIAISTGGIYVELIIASVATLVWWHTGPGTAHSIAFALMTLCSLSTVLVNANPLMRFDGYYIFSDLLEIPNLRPKSQAAVQSLIDRYALGLDAPAPRTVEGNRWLFVLYAAAAYLYGWFLALVIVWFFYTLLQPYRLSSISVALAVLISYQMLVVPIWRNVMRLKLVSRTRTRIRWGRVLVSAAVLGGLIYGAVFVPIPRRVWGVLTVEGVGQQTVFVPVPGRMESLHVQPGSVVSAGQVLAELVNPELDAQITYLEHRLAAANLSAETFAALGHPAEEQAIRARQAEIAEELRTRREQRQRLTIRAERAGRIVAVPSIREHHAQTQGYTLLSAWQGHPLRPENVGARLEAGAPLCELLPEDRFEAVLLIEQAEIAFLTPGQSVRIKLDAFPERTLWGTLQEIGSVAVEVPPPQLLISHGGELPVRIRPDGRHGLPGAYYEVRVAIDRFEDSDENPHEMLCCGMRGRARIDCGHWTCWDVLMREFHQLFHL